MHLLGLGLKDAIEKITGVESATLLKLRKQYAKSNRDLFGRILRPVDAIWQARGGGMHIEGSATTTKGIKEMIGNVADGYSLRAWVKNFVFPRYLDDPMGVILMEVNALHPNKTYPTYKSSADIIDARINGRKIDYLILKTSVNDEFRIIDDESDRIVKYDGKEFRTLKDKGFYKNPFGYVPAVIISDLPLNGQVGLFESPIASEVELAHEYLVNGSIRRIYEFKHGFPKEWRYPLMCDPCKGTGLKAGEQCTHCNGTGKGLKDDPEKVWIFDFPSKDAPELTEKGGFVNPSIEYLEYVIESQRALESLAFESHWGTKQTSDNKIAGEKETATGRFLDVQPVNNRQGLYASVMEDHEQFIIESIGKLNFTDGFKGVSVSYGRRFVIESPDELIKKYQEARKNGVAVTTLDDMYIDYLESKFQNQRLELEKQIKLMRVEPFFHLSVMDAQRMIADPEIYKQKLFFSEWLRQVPPITAAQTSDELRADMMAYVKAQKYEVPEPEKATTKPTF